MDIINKLILPKPTAVLDTYWKFANERQLIFFNKINNISPLTSDNILNKHKFTNCYRASDRISQYLIKNVIYASGNYNDLDMLLRILLFKIFNKISTWELLEAETGDIRYDTFKFNNIDSVLSEAKRNRETIYSGAYIMASGKSIFGYQQKHSNHIKLLEQHITPQLLEKIRSAKSLEQVYLLLLSIPTFGKFLAYQYTIDLNYSEIINFSEMDFVVPGPGALDGIRKCFSYLGDYSEVDVIKWVTENQEAEFKRLDIDFRNLWGRPLQLIDCQNLFCETDKYARVAHPEIIGYSGRKRIKQIYKPNQSKFDYFFPPKWGINGYQNGNN